MKKLILIVSVLFLAACTSFQIKEYKPAILQNEHAYITEKIYITALDIKEPLSSHLKAELTQDLVNSKLLFAANIKADKSQASYQVNILETPQGYECFSEPLLTFLSLGLIPNISCFKGGYRIEITDLNNDKRAEIDTRYKVKTFSGLFAEFKSKEDGWLPEQDFDLYTSKSLAMQLHQAIQSLKLTNGN